MNPTFQHNPHDAYWIASRLNVMPLAYQEVIGREYAHLFKTAGQHEGEKRRHANLFLLGLSESAKKRVFGLSDEEIKRKAERLALRCRKLTRMAATPKQRLDSVVALYQSSGFSAGDLAGFSVEGVVKRLEDADFWRRKLTRSQDRLQEHLAIQLGEVQRKRSCYISSQMFGVIQARQQASIRALAALEAYDEVSGETLDMLQVLKGSVANPEVRRAELMIRIRGFEQAAEQAGHVGMFYTITCPSKYHRFTVEHNAKGKVIGVIQNPNYADYTPRQGQAYLSALWARIRAKLKRQHLTAYGFRVAEPHHDGCPHWHILLFMPSEQHRQVTAIMKDYALREDGNEKGAAKHRFKVEAIDKSKGSATGYIAKYIAKNIDGFGLEDGGDGGIDPSSSAQRVRAWASLWGIRQFQQVGGAPVTVWRELRRLTEAPEGLLEQARLAADSGDWCQYLTLQGGVTTMRKDQPLKLYTMERINSETGEILSNKYGEIVAKVDGIAWLDLQQVKTRVHEWVIRTKESAPVIKPLFPVTDTVQGYDLLASVVATFPSSNSSSSACAAPWSTGNNCTVNHFVGISHEVGRAAA